jgi:predicted CXXCH cytochrome family protein
MRGYIVALAAAGVALFLSFDARALDAPHDFADAGKTVEMQCDNCHTFHGATYPTLLGQLCQSCHVSGGEAPEVKTHSSRFIDNSYGNWEVDCWKCHDPHRQWQEEAPLNATRGVFLRRYLTAPIKEIDPGCTDPYCSPLSTLRTESGTDIQFDAATGTDFVDGDAESIDDICQTCHEQTTNYNSPLLPDNAPSNTHTDYGTDTQAGGNCMACHDHAEGFAVAGGGGCTSCHASLQGTKATPVDYRRQVAGAGGDFSRTSHHVTDGTTTEIVADADCQVCHKQDNHQSNTPPDQVLLYDVDDPTGVTEYVYNGTGASIEPFCLSCHDSNAANGATPFSDGRTPPDIESLWTATGAPHAGLTEKCLSCHGGFDSTDAALPDYEHNVHGSCNDTMLSSRVAGGAVTPTVSIARVDRIAPGSTGDLFEINVNSTLVATYSAARTDTADMIRDDLIADINGGIAHGQPVSAEATGPIGIAVKPNDACTSFTIDLGGTGAGFMTLTPAIRAANYVCLECHDADGPATRNVAAEFSIPGNWKTPDDSWLNHSHDIKLAMDCTDCHNPHGPNGLGFAVDDPRRTLHADPDPTDAWAPGPITGGTLWTNPPTPSTWLSEWCLSCHDGSFPASIRPPLNLVNIYDVWLNPASAAFNQHGLQVSGADMTVASGYPDGGGGANTVLNCEACHIAGHDANAKLFQTRLNPLDASGNPILVSENYATAVTPIDYANGTDRQSLAGGWCTACHQTDMGKNTCDNCHKHGDVF